MKPILPVTSKNSNCSWRSHPSPWSHAPPPRAPRLRRRRDLGRQLRRDPRRPRALPSAAVRRAALRARGARPPLRPQARCPRPLRDRRRAVHVRRSVRLSLPRHRQGHARRARVAGDPAPGRVHGDPRGDLPRRAPAADPAGRRRARVRGHRHHRRRPRRGGAAAPRRPRRAPRALLGHRQRGQPQGRLSAPARHARVVEPRPAGSAARALADDRVGDRHGVHHARRDRRRRAAVRRAHLHVRRLRRVDGAARPPPREPGRAVRAAGAGVRHRIRVGVPGGSPHGGGAGRRRRRPRRPRAHGPPAPRAPLDSARSGRESRLRGEGTTQERATMPSVRRTLALAALGFAVLAGSAQAAGTYKVDGVRTQAQRSAVARTGAAIVQVSRASVLVTAARSEVRALRRAGFRVTARARKTDFPAADAGYHNYAEMTSQVNAVRAAHPDIVSTFSAGSSFQGRALLAAKVSDNVGTDESEPEVLFTCGQHAREHLTIGMCLYLLDTLANDPDTRVRTLVNTRETWFVFNLNPDGSEYDIATGSYRSWRKNRQGNGTDLNRNWSYQWGCCGGSSGTTTSETYRGPSAFSAPETAAVRNFVQSRVVGGQQQIKVAIDFHTYSELVLWPYGYTTANTAAGLTADDQAALSTIGRDMAGTNGYTPEQASDLYIADGTIDDWLWGNYKTFAYTFEMYPTSSNPGFYPPDEVISREVTRNREAVLRLMELADCPYRSIGKESQYCGVPSTTVYSDDFEAARGWTVSGNAATGAWQRGTPQATSSSGPKQLATTTSGVNAFVTGLSAGAAAGDFDVDGGITTITSPAITLPTGSLRLSLNYYLAHGSNASADDFFRVRVNGTTVLNVAGAAVDRDAAWTSATINLDQFAGQTVQVAIEAGDLGTASLLEAAVDDVRVSRL